MSMLTTYEKRRIAKELKVFRIKYAEIYNEVYDHLVSACEFKRLSGDQRPIHTLFLETMEEDIGNHDGITRMTEERETWMKGHLTAAVRTEFKSYFTSSKGVIPVVIASVVYAFARWVAFNPSWLMATAIVLSLVPVGYLTLTGVRNGYLRTVASKRKTSLVNRLMFGLSLPRYLGAAIGVFSSATFSAVLGNAPSGSRISNGIIQLLGYPGLAMVVTLVTVYVISYIKLANTDYKRLVRQVGGVNE